MTPRKEFSTFQTTNSSAKWPINLLAAGQVEGRTFELDEIERQQHYSFENRLQQWTSFVFDLE